MAANSSSASPALSFLTDSIHCLVTGPSSAIFSSFIITNILLLLPLCSFVLLRGLQERRRRPWSHSDVFTLHMVAMETVRILGCVACCFGVGAEDPWLLGGGNALLLFTWYGETFFHVLTCVERHLAVVHPLAYRRLREERWARRRDAAAGAVWLLCCAEVTLSFREEVLVSVNFCLLTLALALVSFCSVSTLRVLIRPGPGGRGGAGQRAEPSKRRAFCTIAAILLALLLRFSWCLSMAVLTFAVRRTDCEALTSGLWCSLPSSLLLPLLFLLRHAHSACRRRK